MLFLQVELHADISMATNQRNKQASFGSLCTAASIPRKSEALSLLIRRCEIPVLTLYSTLWSKASKINLEHGRNHFQKQGQVSDTALGFGNCKHDLPTLTNFPHTHLHVRCGSRIHVVLLPLLRQTSACLHDNQVMA